MTQRPHRNHFMGADQPAAAPEFAGSRGEAAWRLKSKITGSQKRDLRWDVHEGGHSSRRSSRHPHYPRIVAAVWALRLAP